MPVNRRLLSGLCLSGAHAGDFLEFVDSLEARIITLELAVAGSQVVFSTLGVVTGGDTVAAGTVEPATAGVVIIDPGASTEIFITGVDVEPGDAVFHTFSGSPVSFPTNPANRRDSGRVVSSGVIGLALSSTNPDLSYSSWLVIKKPAV